MKFLKSIYLYIGIQILSFLNCVCKGLVFIIQKNILSNKTNVDYYDSSKFIAVYDENILEIKAHVEDSCKSCTYYDNDTRDACVEKNCCIQNNSIFVKIETIPELEQFSCSGCIFSTGPFSYCVHPNKSRNISMDCYKNHTIYVKK